MGIIKNQSKLNVNVSGIGRFFKRLQHKQCGLKKLCIFGFLGKSINQLSKNGVHYNSIMHNTKEELTAEEKETKKNNRINSLKEEINGQLKKGHSVLMSLFPADKGHIVRVVSVSDEGIVFDDPYGKLPPAGFIARQNNQTGYDRVKDRNNPGVESPKNRGKHVLYTWTDLTNCNIKYYYVIYN
ncbi:MAG: hypothetical protein J6Y11_14585 [Paludibacteraceae bacterium]|nr:hypothetical protein [Paludibacteraceae bacterium]